MEIYREGKKIILTEQELFLAYEEQENIYDMENVRENMGTYLTKEQYSKFKENKKFINVNNLTQATTTYSVSFNWHGIPCAFLYL